MTEVQTCMTSNQLHKTEFIIWTLCWFDIIFWLDCPWTKAKVDKVMIWAAFSGWELLPVIFIDVIWEIGVWLKIFQWWPMQLSLQVLLLQTAADQSFLHSNLSHNTAVMLVSSFIVMCMKYCNAFLADLWKFQIHQSAVDYAVNRASRVVVNLQQFSHILNCMQKTALAHWWESARSINTSTTLCSLWRSDSPANLQHPYRCRHTPCPFLV